MIKSKFKSGEIFKKWQLVHFIQAGGNGEVWEAIAEGEPSQKVAIKFLKKLDKVSYARFRDEIKVLKDNSDIPGLLPIIDFNLPHDKKRGTPWYVMPLAVPIFQFLKDKTSEFIVDAIITVADILIALHERGISHRDIKPPNILVKDDTIFLSDFGLVKYPNKKDITLKGRDVGPRWTIAPEMKRNPNTSDGRLADVYSLAKTLWILLTKEKQGFDGQYNIDSHIELKRYVRSIYHTPIDALLHRCTDHAPKMRKGVIEFKDDLITWKGLNADFEKRTKSEWVDIQRSLFPAAMPKTVIWDITTDILEILNIISEHGQLNHTLLPGGGGLDLTGTRPSFEMGCIELLLNDFPFIVKPSRLIFESFPGNMDWSYFRLDTKGLELIGDYVSKSIDEDLTEISPCVYTEADCYKFNDFNGERLPDSARSVIRVTEGAFMICLRTGIYNSIPETYDGRHNKLDADEFRKYIEKCIQANSAATGKGEPKIEPPSDKKKPKYIKSDKIRRGSKILSRKEIQLLEMTISFSEKARDENSKLKKEAGFDENGIDVFAESTLIAMANYKKLAKPHNKAFKQYLNSLSNEDLALIEAVMYGGRDALTGGRAFPLDEMLDRFKEDSRTSRFRAITEKASIVEFLTAGLNAYR